MSKILKAVHRSAEKLHAAGHMDDITMREFDGARPSASLLGSRRPENPCINPDQPGGFRGDPECRQADGRGMGTGDQSSSGPALSSSILSSGKAWTRSRSRWCIRSACWSISLNASQPLHAKWARHVIARWLGPPLELAPGSSAQRDNTAMGRSRRERRVLAPSHAPFYGAERTSGRHV